MTESWSEILFWIFAVLTGVWMLVVIWLQLSIAKTLGAIANWLQTAYESLRDRE